MISATSCSPSPVEPRTARPAAARSISGVVSDIAGVGCWMLDAGCRMLDVGCSDRLSEHPTPSHIQLLSQQVMVEAALGDQFVVGAGFDDHTAVKDDDPVLMADGTEAVSDQDRGAVRQQ